MDFNSNSDRQEVEVYDEETNDRDFPTRYKAKKEEDRRGFKEWITSLKEKEADDEEAGEYSPSRSRSSRKKMKLVKFRGKPVLKIMAVAAIILNFYYIFSFMKIPFNTFYHTLMVVGICAGINFLALWILFSKRPTIRFFLSLFALIGSFAYYFYVNYTNQSFLGNNLIPSVLVVIAVFMSINPKANYYVKIFFFVLIPVIGIYVSSNKFALVWTLMLSAGLLLQFRIPKTKKKKAQKRSEEEQSA